MHKRNKTFLNPTIHLLQKKNVICDSRKFAFVCQGNQSENNVHKKETKNKDMKSFFIFPHHL